MSNDCDSDVVHCRLRREGPFREFENSGRSTLRVLDFACRYLRVDGCALGC